MSEEVTLKIDVLACDSLDRSTDQAVMDLLALAETLEREAQEKQLQARQLKEAARVMARAHALFDMSDADAMDMVPDDEMN